MKFTCEKSELQNIVMIASRASASKSPVTALECLLIEALDDKLSITGYDLRRGINAKCDAKVIKEGSALFSTKIFVEIIRKLPDGMVTITVGENETAKIKCGRSDYALQTFSSADYPELPEINEEKTIEISQVLLKSMIDETVFAVSQNMSRPVFTGSLFEFNEGELTMVSVDGYRLALRKEKIENFSDTLSFIVQGAALQDLARLCIDDKDAKVLVNITERYVSFTLNDSMIFSRKLEGEFLNYKKVMPNTFKSCITVDRAEFLEVVDRVSIMVDEKLRSPLRLVFSNAGINLLCSTPAGRAEDFCQIEGECDELEIGFNDRYLRDTLRNAPCKKLIIGLNSGSSPCMFLPEDNQENFAYMILPVRLRAGD